MDGNFAVAFSPPCDSPPGDVRPFSLTAMLEAVALALAAPCDEKPPSGRWVGLFIPHAAGQKHQNQGRQPEQDEQNRPPLRQAIG
jgi:hypothetical protein